MFVICSCELSSYERTIKHIDVGLGVLIDNHITSGAGWGPGRACNHKVQNQLIVCQNIDYGIHYVLI